MKKIIFCLTFTISLFFGQINAQTIVPKSPVFFKMSHIKESSLNGPIPRGFYHFENPLYIIGNITKQDLRYASVEIKAASFLYTCSHTSDVWIQTSKITVEKYSFEGKLVGTEVWDLEKESTYKQKIHLLRPHTAEMMEVLTKGKVISKTNECPVMKATNTIRTRTKR